MKRTGKIIADFLKDADALGAKKFGPSDEKVKKATERGKAEAIKKLDCELKSYQRTMVLLLLFYPVILIAIYALIYIFLPLATGKGPVFMAGSLISTVAVFLGIIKTILEKRTVVLILRTILFLSPEQCVGVMQAWHYNWFQRSKPLSQQMGDFLRQIGDASST
jgi:hypothetical protein